MINFKLRHNLVIVASLALANMQAFAVTTPAQAIAKIQAYASSNTNPVPTLEDYKIIGEFSSLVNKYNLKEVNKAIDVTKESVATKDDISYVIDEGAYNFTMIGDTIQYYIYDSESQKPDVSMYQNFGMSIVTSSNVDFINSKLGGSNLITINKDSDDWLFLVSGLENFENKLNEIIQQQKELIQKEKDQESALSKIKAYAADNTKPAPIVSDFETLEINGVNAQNLALMNVEIDSIDTTLLMTKEDIQILVNRVNNLNRKLLAQKDIAAAKTISHEKNRALKGKITFPILRLLFKGEYDPITKKVNENIYISSEEDLKKNYTHDSKGGYLSIYDPDLKKGAQHLGSMSDYYYYLSNGLVSFDAKVGTVYLPETRAYYVNLKGSSLGNEWTALQKEDMDSPEPGMGAIMLEAKKQLGTGFWKGFTKIKEGDNLHIIGTAFEIAVNKADNSALDDPIVGGMAVAMNKAKLNMYEEDGKPVYINDYTVAGTDLSTALHEWTHVIMNVEDYYGSDKYVNGERETDAGIGDWCMMSSSSTKSTPPIVHASLVLDAGWANVEEVKPGTSSKTITIRGNTNETSVKNNHFYVIYKPGSDKKEYILLEYRKKTGVHWNKYSPGEGLLIWHVDRSNGINGNYQQDIKTDPLNQTAANHYEVNLIQGDGRKDLENQRNNPLASYYDKLASSGSNSGDVLIPRSGDACDPFGANLVCYETYTSPTTGTKPYTSKTTWSGHKWWDKTSTGITIDNISVVGGETMTFDITVDPVK